MTCFFVTSSKVVFTCFIHRKGSAIGVVACEASVSGVVYPVMAKYLITAMGFDNAGGLLAVVVTATSIFSLISARTNPEHSHPETKQWMKLKTWVDTDIFKNKAFCWFMVAIGFLRFSYYAVLFNLEEWAAKRGFGTRDGHDNLGAPFPKDAIQTSWLLSILNIGRLLMAVCSMQRLSIRLAQLFTTLNSFGALNIYILTTTLSSLLTLLLWTLASAILFGSASGAVIGLPPAFAAHILAPRPAQQAKLGQWTGMMYSCAVVPSLAGPVVVGHLITRYRSHVPVQVWSGVCLMASAGCMVVALGCSGAGEEESLRGRFSWRKEGEGIGSVAASRAALLYVDPTEEKSDVEAVESRRIHSV